MWGLGVCPSGEWGATRGEDHEGIFELAGLLQRLEEPSRRRDCHFADTPSPSLLKHLLKGEEDAANDRLADG